MTNYHLKPPNNPLPYLSWQETKEKRRKLLEAVRQRRKASYRRFFQKQRKTNLAYWQ